jgi:hypothetical protein
LYSENTAGRAGGIAKNAGAARTGTISHHAEAFASGLQVLADDAYAGWT